jgi:RecA-family ATPase
MAATDGSPASAGLLPHHARMLALSAISGTVARERGYRSVTDARDLRRVGFAESQRRVPALLIPIHDVGGRVALHQSRPDEPRTTADGKIVKYETPYGKTIPLDVPPRARGGLGDGDVPLVVTEGSKKVDAAVTAGLCAVGVIGVDSFRTPCWQAINTDGRLTIIAYDNDVMVKPEVHGALKRIGQWLRRRGADVRYAYLPSHDGAKVGLDDWFAAGGQPGELLDMATPVLRPAPRAGTLTRRPLDTVRFEPVRFLVPDRVPLQAVTLLVGDPGLGKSTWTCLIAAGATRGLSGEPTTVAIVNAEDSLKAVIGPRMRAAGADLERVEALSVMDGDHERLITLPDDVDKIEGFIVETGARLLILDPLMAFLTDKADANQDHSVRRALGELALMAERHDVAVIVACHLNKDEQKSLLYRVGGSIGLVGAARSILLFARDPDDPDGDRGSARLVAHAKFNWAQLAATLRYKIQAESFLADDDTIETSRLIEDGESDLTAEQLVGKRKDAGKVADAMEAIKDALADGPRPSSDVKREVQEEVECSVATVKRAAERLRRDGVLTSSGETSNTTWLISLSKMNEPSENPVVEPDSTWLNQDGEGNEPSGNGKVSDLERERLRRRFTEGWPS